MDLVSALTYTSHGCGFTTTHSEWMDMSLGEATDYLDRLREIRRREAGMDGGHRVRERRR